MIKQPGRVTGVAEMRLVTESITTPENTKKGFVVSQAYWRDNLKDMTERWTAWKLA